MRADLHVHSSASDGTDPPAEVMRRAARAGLDVVALTDHDTVAGHAEARAAAGPLAFLPGMELSCRLDGRSLHMLAYLFDPDHPELAAELARIRDDRVIRARAMVDRLAGLGVDISWDQVARLAGQAVVGRPHIARAMAASGAIASPREAFTRDWIADGGRAYVGRYALDPVHAIGLVRAAGGVTVLAHPRAGRDTFVSDEQITGLAAAGLAGLEVRHPDQSATERARLLALARDLALVATGGSDDHGSLTGYRLGSESTPADAYAALVSGARPGGSVPLREAGPRVTVVRKVGGSHTKEGSGRMTTRIDQFSPPGGEVNTWIIGDDEEVIVIDPGTDPAGVLDAVGDREVLAVICTHGHAAHVTAAIEVAERDEAAVALHPRDRMLWRETHPDDVADIDMAEGGVFEVADVQLEVIHAPGHTPGSVCLYCEDLGVVFTGHVMLADGPAEPEENDFPDFAGQLNAIGENLLTLPEDTRVLPGQGPETTVGAAEKKFDSWAAAGPAISSPSSLGD